MSTDREKALDIALAQIDKQYGKGSIMRMGDKASMAIESVPTGALALDLALGVGGLPRGRVTEIYGPESSGKSTLAMHVVAEAQRNGGVCAYIDAEHAMDPIYAKAIGVDIDQLLISQPDTGEQALEICDMLVRSGALDVVVIDSVAALTPRAEIEGRDGRQPRRPAGPADEPGAAQAHRQPQQDQDDRHLHQPAAGEDRRDVRVARDHPRWSGAEVLLLRAPRHPAHRVPQGRRRGGRQPHPGEGRQEQGVAALQAGRVRHHVRQGDQPGRLAIDMSVDLGIVKKSGAWFTYEGEQLGQGRENAKSFLIENPEIMVEISDKVLVAAGLKPGGGRRRRRGRGRSLRPTRNRSSWTDYATRSHARLEDHQVEDHDQQQMGDADARASRLRAVSLVSVNEGRIRNQLTSIRITQPISDSTIHVCVIFQSSSDMPTMPIPSTHTSARAGSETRRCSWRSSPRHPPVAASGRRTGGRRRRSRRARGAGPGSGSRSRCRRWRARRGRYRHGSARTAIPQ